MTDRSVLVRLRADISDYQRKMMSAAAGTQAFANRLDQADSRMANLVQTGLALVPALVPIGGLAVPAIAGLTAQLGFAATGAGVTLLAFQGVGDALDALNKYQLEPTADNFADLQTKMATLGPAGQDFVRVLQSLRPEMQHLQDIAEEGLFDGMTDGIEESLQLMPQVEQLIGTVSKTMGDLSREAGDNLNDPKWVEFFEYLDREAGPTLEAMGKSFGNVIEGLTQMMMAFDPLIDDFNGGLLRSTRAFNDWASGLDSSQGFQEFLDYIQDTGPEALDTLEAIGNALVALVSAAAPVGSATLPIIEGLADGLAAIADSPVGPVLIGAAAAVGVLGRSMALLRAVGLRGGDSMLAKVFAVDKIKAGAVALTTVTTAQDRARMSSAKLAAAEEKRSAAARAGAAQLGKNAALIGGLALATSGYADKTGLANTASFALMGTIAGPWGTAIGGGIGLTMDLASANNNLESALSSVDRTMQSGTFDQQKQSLRELRAEITEAEGQVDDFWSAMAPGSATRGMDWVNQLKSGVKGLGIELSGGTGEATEKLSFLQEQMKGTGDVAGIMGAAIGMTGDQMRVAAGDAQALSGALAELAGWLDQRAALREYEGALDKLSAGLKDNQNAWDVNGAKGRANLELLDKTATGIIKVAENIKNTGKRNTFLAGARQDLMKMAEQFPGADKAIGKIIRHLDALGLTRPKPKVDADTGPAKKKLAELAGGLDAVGKKKPRPRVDADTGPVQQKVNAVDQWLATLTGTTARPKVTAETGQASSALAGIQAQIAGIRSKSVTITVNKSTGHSMVEPHANIPAGADGMTVPGARFPYGDKVMILAAPGEEVVTNRHGEADHLRATGRLPGFADGGTPKPSDAQKKARDRTHAINSADRDFNLKGGMSTHDVRQELREFARDIHKAGATVGKSFDKLGDRSLTLTKRFNDNASKLENVRSRIADVRSTAAGSFNNNPFEGGLSDFDIQVGADTNDARSMTKALKKAHRRGLDGPLAAALAGSENVLLTQQFARLSPAEIARRERAFNTRSAVTGALGQTAVDVSGLPRQVDRLVRSQDRLTKKLERLEDRIEGAVERGAHKGSSSGTGQRVAASNRSAANRARTGR